MMFPMSSTAILSRCFATARQQGLFQSTAKATTAFASCSTTGAFTTTAATEDVRKTTILLSNSSNVKHKNRHRLGTLRVVGPDRHGILAACTRVLNNHGCNIVKHEQWTDTDIRQNMFFQRVSFHYNDGNGNSSGNATVGGPDTTATTTVDKDACEKQLKELLLPSNNELKALWDWGDRRKKLGILVSKYDHCLWELLLRHKARELNADIEVVISNHETLRPVAETFGIPYHVTPVEASNNNSNINNSSVVLPPHEAKQLELLKDYDVDVVILARYMQILSPEFLDHFPPDEIINIHHSFLPAFSGGSPYHQAHERGVKLIGATAHYTTGVLDNGPIIEQDVAIVSHRDSVKQLIKKGRVLERNVLLKAIEAHLDDRVIVHGNRCVVFGD